MRKFKYYKYPDGVTSIGFGAFEECTKLSSINIPNSVTSIGVSAFNECTSLSNINIPENVTSIGSYAFGSWTASQTINCEILEANKPSGWDSYWNSNCSAVINWGVSM